MSGVSITPLGGPILSHMMGESTAIYLSSRNAIYISLDYIRAGNGCESQLSPDIE